MPSEASDIPPNKRARTVQPDKNEPINALNGNEEGKSDESILDPISNEVFGRADEFAVAYRERKPYPHGMIHGFCKEGFLEGILEELKQNSKVKFKETDLFRMYQSVDLGNLQEGSDLADNMPNLMKLKAAIYSPEYRAFVEKLTGLERGTLTDEVDCAANCHAKGCHLLCHDDVIGNRKISYIIYLTDVEPLWQDKDGGRLELYEAIPENAEKKSRCVPGALPVKTILPAFNSMAYFVVQPGVSFHSVQEVFCDRPRLSIQGWYHAKDAPQQIENATLQRLKSTCKGEDTEGVFHPMPKDEEQCEKDLLSEEDRAFLGIYINKVFLTDESLNAIRSRFEEESSVQLRHFLVDEWCSKIKDAIKKKDENDQLGNGMPSLDYNVGVGGNWKVVGPAHKQRFLEYQGDDTPTGCEGSDLCAGKYLHQIKALLFQSAAFGRWIGLLTSLGYPLGYRGKIRRFRPGLDYTVAHYGILTTNAVLDSTLCFCSGDGKQCTFDEATGELIGSDDDAVWESGDVGGFECYIAADESGEDQGPDAEYDEEDDTKLLSVSASNNTLSLVYRDPGTMRFVKYVGCGAPSSRWDLALEYDVDNEGDSDVYDEDGEHQNAGASKKE
mmetsp:Transcript_8658/g.18491  ORF Transcript_8658/g.18491 Transcript_8658/m.18491 type:complete len:613 (+) Transcript_8658:124-1962(+)